MENQVQLKNLHLLLEASLASQLFASHHHVDAVFYASNKTLLLAPENDSLFRKLHKTQSYLIKDKNLKGDKCISLEELLIDFGLDSSDRVLQFKMDINLGILNVYF